MRVVGNLPYNLTTPILFRLAKLQEQHGVFYDATLMVQREVADRLAARPRSKDYGVLTVSMQLTGRMERLLNLPLGAFKPAPKGLVIGGPARVWSAARSRGGSGVVRASAQRRLQPAPKDPG